MLNNTVDPEKVSLLEAALSATQNSSNYVHFLNSAFPDSILLSMFISKEYD